MGTGGDAGAERLAEGLKNNSSLTSLDFSDNKVGAAGAGWLVEAFTTNSTLTTLDLTDNKMGEDGAGRLAEALATNSSLTRVYFDWDWDTRRLVDAHLNRNKGNLEKKSALLFVMLLPSLSLDGDEKPEEASLSLVSIAVEDQLPSSKRQRM